MLSSSPQSSCWILIFLRDRIQYLDRDHLKTNVLLGTRVFLSGRAARYGDTAEECAEAFFLCGKSLLELAR